MRASSASGPASSSTPISPATKIEWLLRNVDGAERAVFGTIDSWLLFKLTGRHATDRTNASRTMLFDIRRHAWDEELCAMLGIDPARLPEPLPSAHVFGTTTEFGGEVPVAGIAGDQQAALFGQACHSRRARAKNTYGTGSFVLLHTGAEAPEPVDGLLTTVACETGGSAAYALEASIFVTGAAVQWLRDGLGIIDEAAETEALAASLEGNDGVYFVPALTGLGSPHWDPYARGTIVGLTRGSGRAHLARAALEAIAYQTVDAVRAQEAAAGERLAALKADGGAVANRWLMQFQADVLGAPVIVPEIAETTALGAAYLAGIATGRWTEERRRREMWREAARYEPRMGADERERAAGGLAPRARALPGLGRDRDRARNRSLRQGVAQERRPLDRHPPWPRSSHRSTRTNARRSTSTSSTPPPARGSAGPTPSSASSSRCRPC